MYSALEVVVFYNCNTFHQFPLQIHQFVIEGIINTNFRHVQDDPSFSVIILFDETLPTVTCATRTHQGAEPQNFITKKVTCEMLSLETAVMYVLIYFTPNVLPEKG